MLIEFTVDCPECGGDASSGNTLFTDYEPGKPLRVALEFAAGQTTFTCEDCGKQCFTGDVEVFTEDQL